MSTKDSPKPIVNSHVHIFTGHHVPPYLAKQFVIWPFYYLIHLPTVLKLFKLYNTIQGEQQSRPNSLYNKIKRFNYSIYILFRRFLLLKLLWFVLASWLTIHALLILFFWIEDILPFSSGYSFPENDWLMEFESFWAKLLLVLAVLLFFKPGRNLILFMLTSVWKFMKIVPGKQTKKLFERYLLLARFTVYGTQSRIAVALKAQYPPGTSFIILPMDMEFMEAGKVRDPYPKQMAELAKMKEKDEKKEDVLRPFVFADPRRTSFHDKPFFEFTAYQGKVSLKDCFIKEYIEERKFCGFKIYPALGYYPFDEKLLPLWKYAADRQLPIMTHCIQGTIFYRGKKKEEWDRHPLFKEAKGEGVFAPMLLPEKKNFYFSNNFTHPLNYLCLLSEPLLRILVAWAKDDKIRELFGYTTDDKPLKHDLSHLKLCFAHFGGDDQWEKYLEMDRYAYAQNLIQDRSKGIDFSCDEHGAVRWGRLEQVWKYVDWYSIICSLINQYPNVYADISYVLAKPRIFPLLKETLSELNPKIRKRVLFGTDFYVVRNHHSDKDLIAETLAQLTEEEFTLIARENPVEYLKSQACDPSPARDSSEALDQATVPPTIF